MTKGESGLSVRTPTHIRLDPADESLRLKQGGGGGRVGDNNQEHLCFLSPA